MSGAHPAGAPEVAAEEVLWHDLECGGYAVDLPFWRELADRTVSPPGSAPILDVGAGTGRATLDLARHGHELTAVDLRPRLLAALAERAAGLRVETVCADARTLALARRDYALCIVPMQTLQLFGGAGGRAAFLAAARSHLRPGGVLACALLGVVEPFDAARGDQPPPAESARVRGLLHVTRTLSVRARPGTVEIEREREIVGTTEPVRVLASGHELIELDRVSPAELRREGRAAGFAAAPSIEVPATDEHVGSTIVVLRV